MVFEMQGGVEARCAAILHRIASAVAHVEEADPVILKAQLLQRVAIIVARGNAKAVKRREDPRVCSGRPDASRRLLAEAAAVGVEDDY